MKKITLTMLFVGFLTSYGIGQVPGKPEDISPLLIGEKIPSMEITSLDGTKTTLDEIVSKKKTVLLFYRGGWCPYCNVHLAAVAEAEPDILELGFQIIGIAPDSPEKVMATMDKNSVKYQLYSDADVSLIKTMGLAFEVPDKSKNLLTNYSDGKNPGLLPVPSIFVIDQEGTILFEYISPNYKERMSTELLIAVLKVLGSEKGE